MNSKNSLPLLQLICFSLTEHTFVVTSLFFFNNMEYHISIYKQWNVKNQVTFFILFLLLNLWWILHIYILYFLILQISEFFSGWACYRVHSIAPAHIVCLCPSAFFFFNAILFNNDVKICFWETFPPRWFPGQHTSTNVCHFWLWKHLAWTAWMSADTTENLLKKFLHKFSLYRHS